ncbi:hypothetical protein BKA82DRAFT_10586 [Pisolithus tinctorius]|uniref:Uncharacterized protein n=1 Tax=Pisolithus tinctorius Marx 270 TaxID=870435 RepID=A0A0C3NB48_PISTI|nr:hypothetical protein BKA82DRAFT_10586 [Pisolithus tinctorius]KIN98309.1 hypothetical protein M404DRAFT_10586 [Pisolithus tinctorius Marx 270]
MEGACIDDEGGTEAICIDDEGRTEGVCVDDEGGMEGIQVNDKGGTEGVHVDDEGGTEGVGLNNDGGMEGIHVNDEGGTEGVGVNNKGGMKGLHVNDEEKHGEFPKTKTLWIITGDIIAYYLNINYIRAVKNISLLMDPNANYWPLPYLENSPITKLGKDLWESTLEFRTTDLIVKFQNHHYQQTKGIAMGVVTSLDVANLYAFDSDWHCGHNQDVLFLQ